MSALLWACRSAWVSVQNLLGLQPALHVAVSLCGGCLALGAQAERVHGSLPPNLGIKLFQFQVAQDFFL